MKKLFFAFCLLTIVQSCQAKIRVGTVEVNDTKSHYLKYVRYMTVPQKVMDDDLHPANKAAWLAGDDAQDKTEAEISDAVINAISGLEDMIQKEMYDKMKASPTEWFEFTNAAHAKSSVLQRMEARVMMKTFNSAPHIYWYAGIQGSPALPGTSASLWEVGANHKQRFYFRQKSGTAYAAITELCDPATRTYGECLGAVEACIWWGSSRAIKQAPFNELYPGQTALIMGTEESSSIVNSIKKANDLAVVIPGDWGHWKNHNYQAAIGFDLFYSQGWLNKTIQLTNGYQSSGENALYVGGGLYEGLGIGPVVVRCSL